MKSFADGLRAFNTKAALYEKVRLNKKIRVILLELIAEEKERTCDLHEDKFEITMQSLTFLENCLTKKNKKTVPNKQIGNWLYIWVGDKKYHYLNEHGIFFEQSLQFIINKITLKYSLVELVKI